MTCVALARIGRPPASRRLLLLASGIPGPYFLCCCGLPWNLEGKHFVSDGYHATEDQGARRLHRYLVVLVSEGYHNMKIIDHVDFIVIQLFCATEGSRTRGFHYDTTVEFGISERGSAQIVRSQHCPCYHVLAQGKGLSCAVTLKPLCANCWWHNW